MYATSKEILVPPLHAKTFESNAEDSDFYFEDVGSIPKQKVKFIRFEGASHEQSESDKKDKSYLNFTKNTTKHVTVGFMKNMYNLNML